MAKVIKIAVSQSFGSMMKSLDYAEAIQGEGIIGDRHFKKINQKKNQITFIESENIDNFNKLIGKNIPYINFRRNIVTQGIKLNDLIKKEFSIGEAIFKVHDLCEPCRNLQESLKEKTFVKYFLHKGGLRCEILTNEKIKINDDISYDF